MLLNLLRDWLLLNMRGWLYLGRLRHDDLCLLLRIVRVRVNQLALSCVCLCRLASSSATIVAGGASRSLVARGASRPVAYGVAEILIRRPNADAAVKTARAVE